MQKFRNSCEGVNLTLLWTQDCVYRTRNVRPWVWVCPI